MKKKVKVSEKFYENAAGTKGVRLGMREDIFIKGDTQEKRDYEYLSPKSLSRH